MAHPHIQVVSRVLRHAVGVLLICWLRALRWGAIAGLCGIIGTELITVGLTHHFPPAGATHIVAIALGAALAFGAAATVIASELITGIVEAVRLLLGEAEAGARAAAVVAEREVGEASAGLVRLVGLGRLLEKQPISAPTPQPVMAAPSPVAPRAPRVVDRSAPPPTPRAVEQPAPTPPPATFAQPPAPTAAVPAAETAHEADGTGDTLAELAALEASGALGPRGRVTGGPVRADLLPRIAWTDEHEAITPEMLAAARAAAAAPTHVEPAQESMPPARPLELEAGTAAPATRPLPLEADAAELVEPAEWHVDEAAAAEPVAWHDPMEHVELEPEDEASGIQPVDLFGAPPPTPDTRPLPENTRPLGESDASATPPNSMWDHISQVLAGRPVDPLPTSAPEGAVADPNASAAGSGESTPPAV